MKTINRTKKDKEGIKQFMEQEKRLKKIKELKPICDKKTIARRLANQYIKIPKGQMCIICNEKLAEQKHHDDYDKPLEVDFVCKRCHYILNELSKKNKLNCGLNNNL